MTRVDEAAEVASRQAGGDAEARAEPDRYHAHQQRGPAPEDDPGEQIAAEVVGAEQELATRCQQFERRRAVPAGRTDSGTAHRSRTPPAAPAPPCRTGPSGCERSAAAPVPSSCGIGHRVSCRSLASRHGHDGSLAAWSGSSRHAAQRPLPPESRMRGSRKPYAMSVSRLTVMNTITSSSSTGLHDHVVAIADGGQHQRAQAWPGEHRFDDDRAAEQPPELQPDRCDDRDQGVAQHVRSPRRVARSGPLPRRSARSPRTAPPAPTPWSAGTGSSRPGSASVIAGNAMNFSAVQRIVAEVAPPARRHPAERHREQDDRAGCRARSSGRRAPG